MNLARYLTGCLRALGRSEGWERYFDLSKKGFKQSFLALGLSLPFYYVCAAAVQQRRAALPGANPANANPESAIPAAAFFVILGLYASAFILTAYILCLVFDKQAAFRPWVIVRHWAIFFASLLAAAIFGAALTGALPFMVAAYSVLGIYLLTLAIDIRLAQRIAGFEWGAAVLTGCIITAMGLAVLLMGVAQFA